MAYLKKLDNTKSTDTRNFEATAMVGEKRTGKSALVKRLVDKYRSKYDVRILVYDISEAFGRQYNELGEIVFEGYPVISEQELLSGIIVKGGKKYEWKRGVKRITKIAPDVFLKFAAEEFTNGLLIIDEATTLFNPNPSAEQIKFLITHTNHKCDAIYIFHMLTNIPKRLRNNFWNYILFSTGDNIDRTNHKQGIKDVTDLGFQNSELLYFKWLSAQVPENPKKIIQKFAVHKKKVQ
jgi:hypothetical protein